MPAVVEVGPAVRSGEHTVVRLRFTTEEDRVGIQLDGIYTMADVCLLSLERGLAWPEQDTSGVLAGQGATRDEPLEIFPVYASLPQDIETVEVFVPNYGVALGVPVVDESEVDYSVASVISEATLDREGKGPVPIEFFSGAADGSLDVESTPETVTVTLASDVTFATDSAELSSAADAALEAAAAEVAKYPSGGSLAIVGHTDDVADDAYNQGLSERRAQAVSARLGELADLSAWQVTVEGKGESEPRVEGVSDEARAANRRVEIVVTATDPSEADDDSALEVGELPPAEGVVGRGPDGVEFDWPDRGRVRLEMHEVKRVGGFLVGTVLATALDQQFLVGNTMWLPTPFKQRWIGRGGVNMAGSDSLTLLVGGMRYLLADYAPTPAERIPLSSGNLPELAPGTPCRMVGVWPDTGQESIVLDLPGTGNPQYPGPIVRLTDIPVVD